MTHDCLDDWFLFLYLFFLFWTSYCKNTICFIDIYHKFQICEPCKIICLCMFYLSICWNQFLNLIQLKSSYWLLWDLKIFLFLKSVKMYRKYNIDVECSEIFKYLVQHTWSGLLISLWGNTILATPTTAIIAFYQMPRWQKKQ